MLISFVALSALLLASTLLNVVLLKKARKKLNRTQSIELQEFLVDLMSGGAMIAVARVDPNGILMRSPKR